jgi:NitT/TauT family transport system substrate-binding protein
MPDPQPAISKRQAASKAIPSSPLSSPSIVDSGDALKLGIGAMMDERWRGFYNEMVKAGVVQPGIDYKKAYTLQLLN